MMKQIELRLISAEEMRKVNPTISKKFGNLNTIHSGSCEIIDGKKRYNIDLFDLNTYKPSSMLQDIGKLVKEKLNADEVFRSGVQIA